MQGNIVKKWDSGKSLTAEPRNPAMYEPLDFPVSSENSLD